MFNTIVFPSTLVIMDTPESEVSTVKRGIAIAACNPRSYSPTKVEFWRPARYLRGSVRMKIGDSHTPVSNRRHFRPEGTSD